MSETEQQYPGQQPTENLRFIRNGDSGIVNNLNGWIEDPRDLIAAIKRMGCVRRR